MVLVRRLGYVPKGRKGEEFDCVRELGGIGSYPRFHIFVTEEGDNLVFNLHLDQKKPSYKGSRAHSGEHKGTVIKKEVERIKEILQNLD